MINKIKGLRKYTDCSMPSNEKERLHKAEVSAYNQAIEDVVKLFTIPDVVGQSEQLKAEDKDLSFADYLEKWYKLPRYEKVYDRKDGKGTDTEDEVIKNYRRAFRL